MEDLGDDNNDRLFGVLAVITVVEVADDVVDDCDAAELVAVTEP